MNLVVDASVAFKWLIDEDGTASALAVRAEHDILAPDLLLVECRNAVLTKVRQRKLSIEQAWLSEQQMDAMGITIVPSRPLLGRAFAIVLDLGAPIYDCIYLAAAIATDRKLITADQRFAARVAKSPPLQNRIEPLRQS